MKINIIEKINFDVFNKILFFINKLNITNYVVSFSGGVDSTVLLNIIKDIKIKNSFINIKAIHINHNINKSSYLYENHCINYCKILNIKLITKKLKKINSKLESEYRKFRYTSISESLKDDEILLTAHNKNDQVETFFLFINRGSGLKGLSGIKDYNTIYNCKVLRPLLNFSKSDILKYAKYNNFKWIEDKSNKNNNINRNFIRNKIIPLIEQKWINFVNSVSKSMKICFEETKILEKYIKNDLNKFINDNYSIKINEIKKENNNFIYISLIIKEWLKIHNLFPTYNQLYYIFNNIINSKWSSNSIIKINNERYITKFKNFLYCITYPSYIKETIIIWKNYKSKIYLPENIGYLKKYKYIDKLKYNYNIKNYIKIRENKVNEIISIQFSTISYHTKIKTTDFNNKKQIKKLWNLYKIPFWLRSKIPLIFYNNKLIMAVGVFITEEGKSTNDDFLYIKYNYNYEIKNFLKYTYKIKN